jgi:hypothetical protein
MNEKNVGLNNSSKEIEDEYQLEDEVEYSNEEAVEYSNEDIRYGDSEALEDLAKEHQKDIEKHEELDRAKNNYDGKVEPSSKIKGYQSLQDFMLELNSKDIEAKINYNPNTFEKIIHTVLAPFGHNYKTINREEVLKDVLEEKIKKFDGEIKRKEKIVETAQYEKKKQKEIYIQANNKASQVNETYFSLDEKIKKHKIQIIDYRESIKTAKLAKEREYEQTDTLDLLIKDSCDNIKKLNKLIEEKESFQDDYEDQFNDYKADADIADQNFKEAKLYYKLVREELNQSKKSVNGMKKVLELCGHNTDYDSSKTMIANETLMEEARLANEHYESLMKKRIMSLPIGREIPKNDYQTTLEQKDRESKANTREEMIKYRDLKLS